jgi:hypothetical protein
MRGKTFTEGHLVWIYKIRLAFFPLLMLFSFLTGTYYVITHPKLTPTWLAPLEKFISETKVNVVILMLLSILIIFASVVMAYITGRRLEIKTKSFVRDKPASKDNTKN